MGGFLLCCKSQCDLPSAKIRERYSLHDTVWVPPGWYELSKKGFEECCTRDIKRIKVIDFGLGPQSPRRQYSHSQSDSHSITNISRPNAKCQRPQSAPSGVGEFHPMGCCVQ